MSATTTTAVYVSRRDMLVARMAAYVELSKPKIASLVLVVVAVSACIAGGQSLEPWLWLHTLLGTALVAASASTFNQLIERRSDALMDRTADRPLPMGRLHWSQAVSFGAASLAAGVIYLAIAVNQLTAAFGALTWLLYVVVYTPLKARTSANTAVGAVAGAMPVLIGWAAAQGSFAFTSGPLSGGLRAAALFLIVYLWQFPHFMAIAWIYRHQYGAAGLQMLTVVDGTGRRAGLQSVLGALALLPVSLLPALQALGLFYVIGATLLGFAYFCSAAIFCWRRDDLSARRLLQVSLVYLPGVLVLLVLSPLV
jgi:protoheme IX farnesyltransferase